MQIFKNNRNQSGRQIAFTLLNKMSFWLSSMAAGCLLFFAIDHRRPLLIYALLMALIALFINVDFSILKKQCSVYKVMASVIISCTMAVYFNKYGSLETSGGINLPASLRLESKELILLLAVIGGIVSGYFVFTVICYAFEKLNLVQEMRQLKQRILEYKNIKAATISLLIIYLLSITPIILANVEYIDDMERKFTGIPRWEYFSRYLSNFLSQTFTTNFYIADASPLWQIIAALLITVSSLIVLIVFSDSDEKRLSFWNVVAVLPLGISPYFLECFSYEYDSPFMALSILASLVPLLFYSCNTALFFISTVIGTLITCTTYQAALGILPIAIIILAFTQWRDDKDLKSILQLALRSAGGWILGVLIYRIFLMKPVYTYVSSELFPLWDMPMGIISNLKIYFSNVLSDFDIKWLVCIAIIIGFFIILSVFNSRKNKVLTVFVSCLTVVITLCLSWGIYIAFISPTFTPRGMYGFGVCIAILAVVCTNYRKSQVPKVAALYLGWCFFVFCFVYGNALAEQDRYVTFVMEQVLNDLNTVPALNSGETYNLQIDGTIDKSPLLTKMPQYEGVLGKLVQTSFGGSWTWHTYYFYNYYGLKNYKTVTDLNKEDLPLVIDGYYDKIYADDNNVLIELRGF